MLEKLQTAALLASAMAASALQDGPPAGRHVLKDLKSGIVMAGVTHKTADTVEYHLVQNRAQGRQHYMLRGVDRDHQGLQADELTQIDIVETDTFGNDVHLQRKITLVPGMTVFGAWRADNGRLFEQNDVAGTAPRYVEIDRAAGEADFTQIGPMDMMEVPMVRDLYRRPAPKKFTR